MTFNSFREYLEYLSQTDYYELLFSFEENSYYFYALLEDDITDLIEIFNKYDMGSIIIKEQIDQQVDSNQVIKLYCNILGFTNNVLIVHQLSCSEVSDMYLSLGLVTKNLVFCDDHDMICGFDLLD